MLCDRVLRNVADQPPAGGIEVSLTWQERRSRALSKPLPDGRTLRILVPPGVILRHGDVIHEENGEVVYITAALTEVLVARDVSATDLLRIAYGLGNLHLPLEIDSAGAVSTPADGPAIGVFRELALATVTERRRFDPLPLPNGLAFQLSGEFVVVRR